MPQKTPPPLPLENLVDRSGLTPSAPHQEKTERVAADHQKRRGGKPKIDLTNRRFGRLVAITEIAPRITKGGNQQVQWRCLCDCGKEKITSGMKLRTGHTKSCGCLHRDRAKTLSYGNITHGLTGQSSYLM